MIQIFYKDKGKISISQSIVFLDELGMDDVIWIDLFSPDGDEKRAVEAFLDTSLSSRAQAEEIESSSRYSETAPCPPGPRPRRSSHRPATPRPRPPSPSTPTS